MELSKEQLASKLGFSEECVYTGAVSFTEFLQWVDSLIMHYDNLPPFVYTLTDYKMISEIAVVIDEYLWSNSRLSKKESEALYGIAVKRGENIKEYTAGIITPKTALKRLEQYPHVVERFRQEFPFIEF